MKQTHCKAVCTAIDKFAPGIAAIVLLALWEAACWLFAVPSFLLPAPSVIVAGAMEVSWSIWLNHLWATLRVSLMGYALAIAVAIPLAIALASSRVLSRALYPILVAVQSTPIVAIAPILIVVLGVGDLPRVVIVFLITFFPIVVGTVTGLLATPDELVELSRSLGASTLREIRNIRLPFAIPFIFAALKVAVTLAVIGAVVAEFVAAERGLGFFIILSTSFFRAPHAFATLAVLIAMSLILFRAVTELQRLLFPWSLPKPGR